MSGFKPAVAEDRKIKLAIMGPSGAGKSLSALRIASGISDKIGVIDSEYGRANDYAQFEGVKPYQVLELSRFDPMAYIQALNTGIKAGFEVIIIDSISQEWSGKGGCLEMVGSSQSQNSFGAWKDVTPLHNQFMVAMLACPVHLIVTVRAKTEYVLEEDYRGKLVPKKVGLKPIQRDGVEYEFTLWSEVDMDHTLRFATIHGPKFEWLRGKEFLMPDAEFGRLLINGGPESSEEEVNQ